MRSMLFLVSAAIGLSGCGLFHDIETFPLQGPSPDGGKCPGSPDMTAPMTKCAAAKGLPGDNLICTDFTTVQTLMDLKGMGWDFTSQCPAGWTVSNAKLEVNNFSTFASSCIFTMRPLTLTEYQKYNGFTLSVVHTVDLNKQRQSALIYLGLDQDTQQLWSTTGTNPRQVSTITVAKTALPNGGSGMYQPWFKITSSLAGGATGWQIESIAVMGNP